MTRRIFVFAVVVALVFIVQIPAKAAEAVPDLLRRQTQELLDAVSSGTSAVWDRYLDPEVKLVDESGTVMTKKEMVDGTKPLPAGVSGTLRIVEFEAAVHRDVAVATHVDDENEEYHGHKLHSQYRTTDTWRKTPAGWRLIASQVLALRTDPPAVPVSAAVRKEYCGQYSLASGIAYEIREKGDSLEGQQSGRPTEELRAESPDVLFVPGKPRYRKIFLRGPDGRITGFADRREAWDLDWKRLP